MVSTTIYFRNIFIKNLVKNQISVPLNKWPGGIFITSVQRAWTVFLKKSLSPEQQVFSFGSKKHQILSLSIKSQSVEFPVQTKSLYTASSSGLKKKFQHWAIFSKFQKSIWPCFFKTIICVNISLTWSWNGIKLEFTMLQSYSMYYILCNILCTRYAFFSIFFFTYFVNFFETNVYAVFKP